MTRLRPRRSPGPTFAIGGEPAYGGSTESNSSVVIEDGTVPGEREPEVRMRWCGCFGETGIHMSQLNLLTDRDDLRNLRINTVQGDDIAWVILQGEADISTLRDLEAALQHVELDGAKSVHLHVSELDFADTATIRQLTVFARQAKQAGHDIKTCGANPTLRKVAHMLEVQDDLGLS